MTGGSRRRMLMGGALAAIAWRAPALANDDPEDWTGKKMPPDVERLWRRLTACKQAGQDEARISAEGSPAQQRAAERKTARLCKGTEADMDRLEKKYRRLRYVKRLFDTFRP